MDNKAADFPRISPSNTSENKSSLNSILDSGSEVEEQKLVSCAFSDAAQDYEEKKEEAPKEEEGLLKLPLN